MHRLWRFAAALLAFAALASPNRTPPLPPRPGPAVEMMAVQTVPLNPQDPAQDRIGRLRYRGGWALSSADRRLGGISAMHVQNGRVTAISDAGDLLRFEVPDGDRGRVEIVPLLQGPGSPTRKSNRDTESMAIHGGTAWIAFENHNQVWRYRTADWVAEARTAPPAMDDWPKARGAEAMTRLPDGRFLIMSESLERDGSSPALLFAGDPAEPTTRSMPVRFRPPSGYRITDVAVLPDGRLLLVTRRITWRLEFPVKLRVSTPGLRSVEHVGGLDNWLTKTGEDKLSLRVRRLKREIAKKGSSESAAA